MLIKCPNFLEIKTVVFNLNGNSASGPDGFGGVFYHSCWDIIGTDNTVTTFKLSTRAKAVPLDERIMICDREA